MTFDDRRSLFGELEPIPPAAPESPPPPIWEPPAPIIAEDLNVPWRAVDVLVLIILTVVWTLFLGFALFFLAALVGVTPAVIQSSVRDQSIISIIAQALADLSVLAYLAVHIRSSYRLPFWRTIGWRKLSLPAIPAPLVGFALFLAGAAISFLVDAASSLHLPGKPLPMEAVFQDRVSSLLFLLMAVLLAPVMEETVFRGYIYPVAARSWGLPAGILFTGALFGLLHGFQLGGAWWQISLLVAVGATFTWVRAATKTVVASYLLHLGYNSFLFAAFLVSTHFLRTMPPP